MRLSIAIASGLACVALGLLALLVFGPVSDAGPARKDAARVSAEATTSDEPKATDETAEETTDESASPQPTTTESDETDPEADAVPRGSVSVVPHDFGTSSQIELTVANETKFVTTELPHETGRVRIRARARALAGRPGDLHGLECETADGVSYSSAVDPWRRRYEIVRWSSDVGHPLASGRAPRAIERSPHANRIVAECVFRPDGETEITFAVNGRTLASVTDAFDAGPFDAVELTAYAQMRGSVVFDALVVEAT